MLNRIILVGRLVQEPELRKSNSDVSIVNFTLAVDNSMKEADGTRGTCFLDCKVFGDKADNLVKYVSKGSKVAIDGSINQRNFIRQDGTKGKAIEVLVDSIEFLDSKPSTTSVEELKEALEEEMKPKFDPMTGKPLKPNSKK